MVLLPPPEGPTRATVSPGPRLQRHAVQRRRASGRRRSDTPSKRMLAAPRGQRAARRARSRTSGLDVEGGEQPPRGGQPLGDHRLQVGQLAQRLRGQHQRGQEGDELAGVHRARAGAPAGVGDHRRRSPRPTSVSVAGAARGARVGALDHVALAARRPPRRRGPPRRPRGSRS